MDRYHGYKNKNNRSTNTIVQSESHIITYLHILTSFSFSFSLRLSNPRFSTQSDTNQSFLFLLVTPISTPNPILHAGALIYTYRLCSGRNLVITFSFFHSLSPSSYNPPLSLSKYISYFSFHIPFPVFRASSVGSRRAGN